MLSFFSCGVDTAWDVTLPPLATSALGGRDITTGSVNSFALNTVLSTGSSLLIGDKFDVCNTAFVGNTLGMG